MNSGGVLALFQLDPDGQRGMWPAHTQRIPSFKGRLPQAAYGSFRFSAYLGAYLFSRSGIGAIANVAEGSGPCAYPKRILARVIRIRGEKSVWRISCAYVFLDSDQHSGRTGSPAHCGRIVVHIPRRIFDMVHPGENRKLIVSVRTLLGQA